MWPEEAHAAADADAAVALLGPTLGPADVVLVKASRVVGLEAVAEGLLRPRTEPGGPGGSSSAALAPRTEGT
jgi:UDP-N-acetylmuramoyl-tripeptide--D-alanyl-D-alanine ligase